MLARLVRRSEARSDPALSWGDYLNLWQQFGFNGVQYVVPGGGKGVGSVLAEVGQRNPIVAACVANRLLVFAEARFRFQQWNDGRPGRLFGTADLGLLEAPYGPGSSTGDLLARMEMDASHYGASAHVLHPAGDRLVRVDPQRLMVVTGGVESPDTGKPFGEQLVGYAATDDRNDEVHFWLPNEVAYYKPLPDLRDPFKGRSWLSSILLDVASDSDMTEYKAAFLRNGATPSLAVTFDPTVSKETFDKFRESMESRHTGVVNAHRVLYLAGAADVKTVGATFDQLALKATQGAGETRIAAAAGVPAAIVGISEGLAGSSLNAGNYAAARRRFADGTIRPLWRAASSALATLVPPPDGGSRLWYDDRDVSFLQEDVKDEADIRASHAQTIRTLTDAGYVPASVVEAVVTGDFTLLEHTGTFSVQLQPPSAAPAA